MVGVRDVQHLLTVIYLATKITFGSIRRNQPVPTRPPPPRPIPSSKLHVGMPAFCSPPTNTLDTFVGFTGSRNIPPRLYRSTTQDILYIRPLSPRPLPPVLSMLPITSISMPPIPSRTVSASRNMFFHTSLYTIAISKTFLVKPFPTLSPSTI